MQIAETKELVHLASSFLAEQEPEAKTIRLEQIEQRSDGEWSIVLSFPDLTPPSFALISNNPSGQVYKELVIDSDSEEVRALRFWKQ